MTDRGELATWQRMLKAEQQITRNLHTELERLREAFQEATVHAQCAGELEEIAATENKRLREERDRFDDEAERLGVRAAEAEIENDRLREQRDEAQEHEIKAVAYGQRLREALEGIAGDKPPFADFQMFGKAEDRERHMIELARAALNPERDGLSEGTMRPALKGSVPASGPLAESDSEREKKIGRTINPRSGAPEREK